MTDPQTRSPASPAAPLADRFPAPRSVTGRLHSDPQADIERAARDPDGFWLEQAQGYEWTKPPTTALSWNRPDMQWFADG